LDHGRGKATLSIERLVRKGLLMEFRQAVAEAHRTDAPVHRASLQVRYQQRLQSVSLEIIPLKGRATAERCMLVLFTLDGAPVPTEATLAEASPKSDARDLEIERLGQGLAQTTEYVHTLVREHESALEELQTTTEEALSSNEELQSLNEELQTAKEEIQSANEELATLNQELQDRNVLLARSNDDTQRGLDRANELVDAVPGPLVILDGDLRVEKANAAFYDLFKTKSELARGRPLVALGARQWGSPELLTALRQVFISGITLTDWPFEAEFPGIGLRTMSLNARRLQPAQDAPGRLVLAIEDRTEVKLIERGRLALMELEHEARRQAEAADRLKDEFVATASHELRGPLTVISGWMNILQDAGATVDPATLAKALAAIGRGVTAQGRLIADLLDYSRLVAGKVELQRAPIDLLAVADAALVGVRAAAEAKDIDVRLTRDGSPCTVLGDSDRMQQVLWNLFLNAIKFTPPKGSVRISIGRIDNQVEISVKDSAAAFRLNFCRTRSIASGKRRARALAFSPGSAWGSRWCARSSSCMAERCGSKVPALVEAQPSPSCYPSRRSCCFPPIRRPFCHRATRPRWNQRRQAHPSHLRRPCVVSLPARACWSSTTNPMRATRWSGSSNAAVRRCARPLRSPKP
jgi:two-component system, chemotaxis family, CheB/CheR fusion protein